MNIVPTNGVVEINKIGNQTFVTGDMIVYPNPTNGDVFVNFKVDKSGETELCLFDVAGRKVFTIINKYMAKGQYVYSTNLSSLASGLYIAKLNTISKIETDKIAKY
jgi:hypothetical protein